jgi:hypothetical protein
MSEEKLDRIERQLELIAQGMTSMSSRIDTLEGTLTIAIREGFESLRSYQVDLDRDLGLNEQKTEDNARRTRRINHRLTDLERRSED